MAEQKSLYERLGGAYAIAGVVDLLVDRLHNNETLNLNKGVKDLGPIYLTSQEAFYSPRALA